MLVLTQSEQQKKAEMILRALQLSSVYRSSYYFTTGLLDVSVHSAKF